MRRPAASKVSSTVTVLRASPYQAADARGELAGQHGLGPQRQVEAGGAAARLGVDAPRGHEGRHVGDVHPGAKAGCLGPHRDGVVEVARAVGVDREGGQRGQIAAAGVGLVGGGLAGAGRRDRRRLVGRVGGELAAHAVGHLEPLEHGRQVAGRAQHLDDHHAVVLGRHRHDDIVGPRRAAAARHEVAALVAVERLERPELAPAHHAGGQQRGRRSGDAGHGAGAGAAAGQTRAREWARLPGRLRTGVRTPR